MMDKKAIQTTFGNNLRKHRAISGKSQEEFAFSADMSAAYLSELERGEKCLTIDTVYKISGGFTYYGRVFERLAALYDEEG